MDDLICKNCYHSFKLHEQNALNIWFCDFEDRYGEYCNCSFFEPKRATGVDRDEIEVSYDNESYKWN